MKQEWTVRVREALEEALSVALERKEGKSRSKLADRGNRRGSEPPPAGNTPVRLSLGEKDVLTALVVLRVYLQMQSSLREHPNYQKACAVLEALPFWSMNQETAIEVVDALSSILGLPFRCVRIEAGGQEETEAFRRLRQAMEEVNGLLGEEILGMDLFLSLGLLQNQG
ncbi:MAG: hypothetical protein Kow009_08650 [Spirochaetales bacterium]